MLSSLAVVLEEPKRVTLARLALDEPAADDVTVETLWSGVSAGTERLLFTGRMPAFPGMGYPLVPGYESVGRVVDAGPDARIDDRNAGVRSGREVLRRLRSLRAWRSRLASGRPGFPRCSSSSRTWRERGAAGSGGDGPACAERLCARRCSHRRPRRPRPPAGAARHRLGRRASGRMGSQQRSGGRRGSDTRSRRPTQMRARPIGRSSMSAAIPRSSIRSCKDSRRAARSCWRDSTIA